MTTREQVHKLVDALPESELEPVAEILASRGPNGTEDEAPRGHDAAKPGDIVDGWGNLSALTRASSGSMLRHLDELEAAAGFSWAQGGDDLRISASSAARVQSTPRGLRP
jgi:hypothetical protein